MYLALVAGAINVIMLHGIFKMIGTPSGGAITTMVLRLPYPSPPSSIGAQSYSSFAIFLIVIFAFGLASFVCGFILTTRNAAGVLVLRKMDFPSSETWRGQHQAIVTMCISSLCLSHFITRDVTGSNAHWASDNAAGNGGSAGFIIACMLAAFSSGLLNTLCFLGRSITVRATHSTATVNDIFLGLGFALRSRSLCYIWRVRLLLLNLFAQFIGGVAGYLIFASTFGASALVFPALLLAPVWCSGCVMLWLKHKQNSIVAGITQSLLSSQRREQC
jgi:hypothetical protein